jgi:hypothetical protein
VLVSDDHEAFGLRECESQDEMDGSDGWMDTTLSSSSKLAPQ